MILISTCHAYFVMDLVPDAASDGGRIYEFIVVIIVEDDIVLG